MAYFRKLIYSFSITFTVVILFSLLTSLPAVVLTKAGHPTILSGHLKNAPPQSKTVDVVARVGGYSINKLSGWTSPFAEVSLSSQGVARKTTADETGFFIFNSVSLPDDPKELCLISQDVNQLPSFPLCLAPPPRNQNIEIRDILLSPTLSLDDGKIAAGKTTKASGMTFPHSSVEVYLFTEKDLSFWSRISVFLPFLSPITHHFSLLTYHFSPKSAFAANFPVYETKSNENGYFEFSLPSSSPSTNRLFVGAQKSCPSDPSAKALASAEASCEGGSPKSNTLSFQIIGIWELFKRFLQAMFDQARFLLPNWKDPLFIILIETLILFGLLAAVIAGKGEEKTKEVKGY